jgi:hypothetical protein
VTLRSFLIAASTTPQLVQGALLNNTGFTNIPLGREAGSGVSTADHVICIGTGGANVNFRVIRRNNHILRPNFFSNSVSEI